MIALARGAGAVTLALLAGIGCREREVPADARFAPSVNPQNARLLYPSAPGSFVDLVASARHGVVAIRATTPVKSGPAAMFPGAPDSVADVALGTGFLVESRGVYVLTNDHIAAAVSTPGKDGAATIDSGQLRVVLADGTEAPAKLLGRDPRLDLALLQIDVPRLHALRMGDSDQTRVGEWVVVLGNAFGDEVSASAGIVSATGREGGSLVQGPTLGYRAYLQTDARIHRGNSGGPVIDTAGQVVGIAVAPQDRAHGELSFVIPINRVKEVLDALRDYGQVARGWLGVLVKPITAELAQNLGLPQPRGALVTEVKAGSPAARSTLRTGDVILTWGGREVDHRSLPWLVSTTPVGRATEVEVWRNRAPIKLAVITEKMPE
ncbi:MAG: trypsin-like peptidase domain-containing protein [Deltaproteobacteria bacterium]|nr:trypsin-like peptidase domain-containing protein [Deltaproteobacteria bacterium]